MDLGGGDVGCVEEGGDKGDGEVAGEEMGFVEPVEEDNEAGFAEGGAVVRGRGRGGGEVGRGEVGEVGGVDPAWYAICRAGETVSMLCFIIQKINVLIGIGEPAGESLIILPPYRFKQLLECITSVQRAPHMSHRLLIPTLNIGDWRSPSFDVTAYVTLTCGTVDDSGMEMPRRRKITFQIHVQVFPD